MTGNSLTVFDGTKVHDQVIVLTIFKKERPPLSPPATGGGLVDKN